MKRIQLTITLAAISFAATFASTAAAATRTWTGAGGNALWSNAANWGGTAPVANDSLVFPSGPVNLSTTNDLAAGTAIAGITINAPGYTLAGNAIAISGNVTTGSFSGTTPVISLTMTTSGTRHISLGTGSLTVTGDIITSVANNLELNSAGGTLTVSGVISGAGDVQMAGAGIKILNGANTFSGTLVLFGGELQIGHASALGTTAGGTSITAAGTLRFTTGMTISENLSAAAGADVFFNTGSVVLNGNFGSSGSFPDHILLSASPGTTVNITGVISGSADFLMTGGGAFTLSGTGSNTLAGDINAFLITLAKTGGAVSVPSRLVAFGTANYSGPDQVAGTMLVTGTLNMNGHSDTITGLSLDGATINTGAGILTVDGNIGANDHASTINGNLRISGASRVIQIEELPGVPVELTVNAVVTATAGGTLRQLGAGTVAFTASSPGFPPYEAAQGVVQFNGFTGAAVSVTGGTLAGTGGVGSFNAPAGTVAPGTSPGTLAAGSFSFSAPATFAVELNGTAPGAFDKIICDGNQTVNGSLTVTLGAGFAAPVGSVWRIIDNAADNPGGISGTFTGKANNSTFAVGIHTFRVNYNVGESDDDVELTLVNIALTGTTKTWSGAGGNALWSNGANWIGGVAPVQGDNLHFPAGAAQFTNTNDFATDITFSGITIGAAYNLGGNRVILVNGINAASATFCTVALPVKLGGNQSFTSSTGELRVSGVGLQSHTLTLDAPTGTSIQGNGVISGTGGIVKEGVGMVSLNDANTFTGAVVANAGTLTVTHPSALGTGSTTTVNSGAILRFDSGGVVMTVNENLVLSSAAIHSAGDDHELTGTIQVTGGNQVVVHDSNLRLDGVISGTGSIGYMPGSPGGSVSLRGGGSNTYSGGSSTTIPMFLNKSGGAVALAAGIVVANTTLTWMQPDQAASTILPGLGATINLNGHNDSITSLFLSGGTVNTGTGTLTVTNAVNLNTNASVINGKLHLTSGTIIVSDTVSATDLTINAVVSGVINKTGSGTLLLTGNNTTTGIILGAGNTVVTGTNGSAEVDFDGGNLSGTGSVANIIVSTGGTFAPGASPGIFSSPSNSWTGNLSVSMEVNGTIAGTGYDQIMCNGPQDIGGANLTLTVAPALGLPTGATLRLINNTATTPGANSGTFSGKAENSTFAAGGYIFRINYNTGTNSNDVELTVVSVAPTGVTKTWSGAGTDNNWTTAANWAGGVAPVPGDALLFPAAAARKTHTNDFPANTFFASLTMDGSGYTISGAAVALGSGGVNGGNYTSGVSALSFLQTPFLLTAPATFSSAEGRIEFEGAINNNGHELTLSTPFIGSFAALVIDSEISGAGGLVKSGAGIIILSRANSFTGNAIVQAGNLLIQNGQSLAPGGITTVNGTLQTAGNLTVPETLLVSSTGTLACALTQSADYTGGVQSMTAGQNFNVTPGLDSTITISGPVTGAGGLRKSGLGKLVLSSNSSTISTVRASQGEVGFAGSNSTINVEMNGGTISGAGSVLSITTVTGGVVRPGGVPGNLGAGQIAFNGAIDLHVDLAASGNDAISTDTALNTLGGAELILNVAGGFTPAPGQQFVIISNAAGSGSVNSGTFFGLPEGAVFQRGGHTFRINYQSGTDGDNDDVMLTALAPVAPKTTASTITDAGGGSKNISLSGTGTIGATYIFQESTDLVIWTDVATTVAAATTGAWSFNLTRPAGVLGRKFFRVAEQ